MKQKKKNRKKVKIFFIILSIVLVVFIPSIMYSKRVEKELLEEVEKSVLNEVKYNSEIVKNLFSRDFELLYSLENVLQKHVVKEAAEVRQLLENFVGHNGYRRILISNLEGDVFSSDKKEFNIFNLEGFQKCLIGEKSISKPILDYSTNKMLVAISIPIIYENEIRAVLAASRELESLNSLLTYQYYNGYGNTYVVDKNGTILMYSNNLTLNERYSNMYEILSQYCNSDKLKEKLEQILSKEEGVFDIPRDTLNKKFAYSKIENTKDWFVICEIPDEIINKKYEKNVSETLVLCCLLLGLCGIIFIGILYFLQLNQKRIEKIAYYDELTGIRNYSKFLVDAKEILSKNSERSYAILFFDIDKFKFINAIYGYTQGDNVLKMIATVLKENLTKEEVFARTESDHFVILSQYINNSLILKKMQRINTCIISKVEKIVKIHPFNLPCGIYRINRKDNIQDISSMIDKANMAQNIIKGKYGTKCTFYTEEIRQKMILEGELESLMYTALKKEEFTIYMQPKYDTQTLKVVGGEALARWNSPTKGFMLPEEFIPLFEKNGFIIETDFYFLEYVCKKIREWIDNGFQVIPISINQSWINFSKLDYIKKIESILRKYDLPTNLIELEISESAFSENMERLKETLNRLHELGFIISIDNFGTGHSSLNLLKDIAIDVLKLDGDFLNEAISSKKGAIIVSNIISMAKQLNIKTVAEKVETVRQMEFLKSAGCDMVQGFLYSKDMTIEEFESKAFTSDL